VCLPPPRFVESGHFVRANPWAPAPPIFPAPGISKPAFPPGEFFPPQQNWGFQTPTNRGKPVFPHPGDPQIEAFNLWGGKFFPPTPYKEGPFPPWKEGFWGFFWNGLQTPITPFTNRGAKNLSIGLLDRTISFSIPQHIPMSSKWGGRSFGYMGKVLGEPKTLERQYTKVFQDL